MAGNHSSGAVVWLEQPERATVGQIAFLIIWIASVAAFAGKFAKSFLPAHGLQQVSPTSEHAPDNTPSGRDLSALEKGPTEPVTAGNRRIGRPTLHVFLSSMVQFGLIMFFFYLCDYKHVFTQAERTYSRDLFCFLLFMLVLCSWYFTTNEADGRLLNRHQTEEWKGWMQVMFVWYHYYRAAEVYNAIRIFIAAYVWMTGFGNFSYFWMRKDFSLYRLMKMMWRLNFLVLVVCVITNNSYMLYYICAMHTFWFLSVYAMMRPFHEHNQNKSVMFLKFAIYSTTVFVLYDVPGVAEVVFRPFGFVLSFEGSLHEWIFRSGLDHYGTLIGMLCAYFHPNIEGYLLKLETRLPNQLVTLGNVCKLLFGAAAAIVVLSWYRTVYILPKYDYNRLHPYTSFIPVLGWLFFRNYSPTLRSWYFASFAWLGKITLETYICQLHVYMQGNAKFLIVFLPGYPLMNFVLASAIYLFLSHRLFYTTVAIGDYLIAKEMRTTGKHVVLMLIVGAVAYAMAFVINVLLDDAAIVVLQN